MSPSTGNSPILIKYREAYKKNPNSTLFAPLAEAYRKLGMIDEAMEILKKGIKDHPNYVSGYICLSSCFVDQEKYENAYNTLKPVVGDNLDNLLMQKLFGVSCEKLGLLEEALETYKYLLFLHPHSQEFAAKVKLLGESEQTFGSDIKESESGSFDVNGLVTTPDGATPPIMEDIDSEGWVQVDWQNNQAAFSDEEKLEQEEQQNSWQIYGGGEEMEVLSEEKSVIVEEEEAEESEDDPVITHTLVDLYCSQGLYQKAQQILTKILKLNPSDEKTRLRLDELAVKLEKIDVSEDEGRKNLMNLYDSKVKKGGPTFTQIETLKEKFVHFLKCLNERAVTVLG